MCGRHHFASLSLIANYLDFPPEGGMLTALASGLGCDAA